MGTNNAASAAATSAARRAPRTIGSVRRPTARSPGSSPRSFTISRTRWIQAAGIHGTTPAAALATASAPYRSARPATSATARFPGRPRRFSNGEYASITPRAPSPTSSAVPLTNAAAAVPASAPPTTHRSAVPRFTRPAARGRAAAPGLARSAVRSQMSFTALPAAPNPTAARAAKTSSLGIATAPRPIQPPASTPAAAMIRLWARTSRRTSITQHVPIQCLVPRHDALGRELAGARRRAGGETRVQGRIAQHRYGPLRQLVHGADRGQVPRLSIHHDLGNPAHSGGQHGHAAAHRLEGTQAERFGLRGQQEQITAAQQIGDAVHLAWKAHVAPQPEAVHLLLGEVAIGAVAREHQRRGEPAPHAGEDAHHVPETLHRPEVRHVNQDLVVGGREDAAAARVGSGKEVHR